MEKNGFKNWWFLAVSGLIFLIFGCLLLFFTREVIQTLVRYFGIVMLAAGAILLIAGIISIRKNRSAAMIMAEAIAGIAIGLALIFFTKDSIALFLMLTGIWAIVIGIIKLVIIVNIGGGLANKNLFLLSALLTITLGIALLFNPFEWANFMGKIIGLITTVAGLVLVYFSFVLRSLKKTE